MTGKNKMMKLIYEYSGGYIAKVDKTFDFVTSYPINMFGIYIDISKATLSSGVGDRRGYTILDGVITNVGNKRNLVNIVKAVRIDEKLFIVKQCVILQTVNSCYGKLLYHQLILEEVYKEGTRSRSK